MLSNTPLLITDISYLFFFVITTLFGILVYLKSSRKVSHIMFLLMTLAIGIYQISHVIGISTIYSDASQIILTFSLSLILVVIFAVHWIAAVVEREKEYRSWIIATYALGLGLVAFYVASPGSFLLQSEPKLYFPNYYVAGSLHWMSIVFYVYGFLLSLRLLLKSYAMADSLHRNRLAYYLFALCAGLPLGGLGFFLTYGIQIDPIFSVPFNFFVVPLAYGTLRYDIMDIKTAARKTLAYVVFVLGTALFIFATNYGDSFLLAIYPGWASWIVPLASSLVIVLFAGYMWERMRDLEVLKYEFITVVTHKFRTPLTRIKWASEIIKHHMTDGKDAAPDESMALSEIDDANEHLVVLTDMLISLRKANDSAYLYEFETVDTSHIVEKSVGNSRKRIKDKDLDLSVDCPPRVIFVSIDRRRMLFALQIIIENAVTYTPQKGKVAISVTADSSNAYIKIADSGMGISKEDLSRVFSKFWRSKEAKTTDTEGMGIGLFMAKEIAERHDGSVSAFSEGLGKGTTFTIRLPLAKE